MADSKEKYNRDLQGEKEKTLKWKSSIIKYMNDREISATFITDTEMQKCGVDALMYSKKRGYDLWSIVDFKFRTGDKIYIELSNTITINNQKGSGWLFNNKIYDDNLPAYIRGLRDYPKYFMQCIEKVGQDGEYLSCYIIALDDLKKFVYKKTMTDEVCWDPENVKFYSDVCLDHYCAGMTQSGNSKCIVTTLEELDSYGIKYYTANIDKI